MYITVAGFKGGVGKTTTAVHLAAILQERAPTLLVDGDPNHSATVWARAGRLPFPVTDERQAMRQVRHYAHVVIDTKARPDEDDLAALAAGCDLLIVPTTVEALALDALLLLVRTLTTMHAPFRVLLTMVPPRPTRDVEEARALLSEANIPTFSGAIRRLVAFQKASLHGVIARDAPDPRAAEAFDDYAAIAREIQIPA